MIWHAMPRPQTLQGFPAPLGVDSSCIMARGRPALAWPILSTFSVPLSSFLEASATLASSVFGRTQALSCLRAFALAISLPGNVFPLIFLVNFSLSFRSQLKTTFFSLIFIYLAVPDLSCGTQDL